MDDETLIRMFKNRDDRAVSELRSKYERLCFRIAGNFLPSPEDAEECVNTAFFEIWNSIPPEEPADLRASLCRIVRHQALKKLEYNTAAKRDPAVTVPLDEIADCVPSFFIGRIPVIYAAATAYGVKLLFLKSPRRKFR